MMINNISIRVLAALCFFVAMPFSSSMSAQTASSSVPQGKLFTLEDLNFGGHNFHKRVVRSMKKVARQHFSPLQIWEKAGIQP